LREDEDSRDKGGIKADEGEELLATIEAIAIPAVSPPTPVVGDVPTITGTAVMEMERERSSEGDPERSEEAIE
jgi:hypothetical protein